MPQLQINCKPTVIFFIKYFLRMSKSTLNWVEDELFRICGLSDVDAAKFLISIAKEAKSKERCFKNIMKTETLEVDEKFTDELWNRGEKAIVGF